MTKYFDELISRKISNSKNAAIHPSSSMSEKQFDEKNLQKPFHETFFEYKKKEIRCFVQFDEIFIEIIDFPTLLLSHNQFDEKLAKV